ncbi:MAG: glutathione S-transferase, partial [Pseudomonadota bacterium]
DAIEVRLSEPSRQGGYLLASGFSAADVSVGQAVYMARHFVPLERHPAVADWYARITARASFERALPSGALLYQKTFYAPWPVEAVNDVEGTP